MPLNFSPLYWIYNDSWNFHETHHVVEPDENGRKKITDKSKHFYQRGHCHLFMPDVSDSGNSRAYDGEQTYEMHIKDEWGPNSSDPNQNQSVSLIGKPIWYFYVEEYWRRCYIQPWDKEDDSCTLPCNRSYAYEKENATSHVMKLIMEYDAKHAGDMQEEYFEYLSERRETAAKEMFIGKSHKASYESWHQAKYGTPYEIEYSSAKMTAFLKDKGIEERFHEFYSSKADENGGFVDQDEISLAFAEIICGTSSYDGETRKSFDLSGIKMDSDGNLMIPAYYTGHVGIKYDASKPCHSLGPFREGQEFFFFNTVVNRTMPVEYWLDEKKKTRQYYLKSKSGSSDDSTKGGQTWTFDGDSSHFTFVQDSFQEAQQRLGDDYEVDESDCHRLRTADRFWNAVVWSGDNAKRLKTDHHLARREGDGSYVDITWYGRNDEVVESGSNSDGTEIHWENRSWTGWYEKGETVCGVDGRWYVRIWSPQMYDAEAYGLDDSPRMPYWTMSKRRHFPNPSPWICEGSESERLHKLPGAVLPEDFAGHLAPYSDDESNRIHRLHWEYLHYYDQTYCERSRYSSTPRYRFVYNYPGGERMISEGGFSYDASAIDTTSVTEAQSIEYIEQGYELSVLPLDWEAALKDAVISSNGTDPHLNLRKSLAGDPFEEGTERAAWNAACVEAFDETKFTISDENRVFQEFLGRLGDEFFTQYSDGYASGYDDDGNEIVEYRIWYHGNHRLDGIDKAPMTWLGDYGSDSPDTRGYSTPDAFEESVSLTYVTFDEFCRIWRPLTDQEIDLLNLNGDYPVRNSTPYPVAPSDEYDVSSNQSTYAQSVQRAALESNESRTLDESSPDLLASEFDPKIDVFTHGENLNRRYSQANPKPPQLPLHPDDSTSSEPEDPFDPYCSGSVNPFEVWKKYFSHREIYTIPHGTTVSGDYTIEQEGRNFPIPHPREMSFSAEDGARRYYPDDRFVSPIIEYQRIVHLDYERLPGKQSEESFIEENWQTAENPDWGDGFDMTITIPYKKGNDIQSPFSESNTSPTQPAGKYFHDVVKPECMMRYHIEFYDSIEQVRRYDFPGYVNLIRRFQKKHTGLSSDQMNGMAHEDIYAASAYQENFNDEYSEIVKYRESTDSDTEDSDGNLKKWSEVIQEFWEAEDAMHHYSMNPVVRNRDMNGGITVEEEFTTLEDGRIFWREKTTHMMPEIDKVERTVLDDGTEFPGYRDSRNNLVKGGKVVEWNNPFDEASGGRWIEQCLGAMVKAKVVLVLEDRLGYRWKQTVEDFAMTTDQHLQGKDHDAS